MAQTITISNITKVSTGNYSVEFSSNFTLPDLYYQVSADGITWQTAILIATTTSPQTLVIPNVVGFNLRLSTSTLVYSNTWTYVESQYAPQLGSQNPQIYYENEDNHGNYQFVFLEELVNNFQDAFLGDNTIIGSIPRHRIVGQMKRGIREFHVSTLNEVKAIELELGDVLDVILPPDFLDFVRVSWLDTVSGMLRPMSINRHLTLGQSYLQDNLAYVIFDDDGNIIEGTTIMENVNNNLPITLTNENGRCCRGYYFDTNWKLDTTINFNGTFNIDNSRIHFSSAVADKIIILEYVSDGLTVEESQMKIHKLCEQALYHWVYNELAKNDLRPTQYQKIAIKKECDTLVHNAKVRMLAIKPEQMMQLLKGSRTWIK
jgi:hypothetical protein